MARLGKEQVIVPGEMVGRGVSVRQVASQFGVSEGAVRYRLKKRGGGEAGDGRANQPTSGQLLQPQPTAAPMAHLSKGGKAAQTTTAGA